jgi:hypothetical protein
VHDRHKRAMEDRGMAACPDCGKIRYMTRKGARRAGTRHTGSAVHTYPCGDFFHFTTETAEQTAARRDFEALDPAARRTGVAEKIRWSGRAGLNPWEKREWDAMTPSGRRTAERRARRERSAARKAAAA